MSPALSLTRDGLVRALAGLTGRPAVDRAVGERADAVAREIDRNVDGVTARIVRQGPSDYAIVVAGPGITARVTGSTTREPDPAIADAIARATEPGP
jgi:hypothetical protein